MNIFVLNVEKPLLLRFYICKNHGNDVLKLPIVSFI